MAGRYDVTLGEIDLVSFESAFSETLGGDYTLVGAAVMPGPPTPLGFYTMSIGVYGDSGEADPYTQGATLRDEVRSLLQNDAARYAGIAFSTTFDTSINGWIVIGQADLSYGQGSTVVNDYLLTINQAAHIGDQQTLLGVHRMVMLDRRLAGAPMDHLARVVRSEKAKATATARHYLPVGAFDVVGQVDPVLPDLHPYDTIFGQGHYVEGRKHMEAIRFDRDMSDLRKGSVRIFDRGGNTSPDYTAEGDRDPRVHYKWRRVYGARFNYTRGDVPVIDNGRCRVRYTDGSTFLIDTVDGTGYKLGAKRISLGYHDATYGAAQEWSADRGVLKVTVSGASGRADVYITLQSGWEGPVFDVYEQGKKTSFHTVGEPHVEEHGLWRRVSFLADDEHLVQVKPTFMLARR